MYPSHCATAVLRQGTSLIAMLIALAAPAYAQEGAPGAQTATDRQRSEPSETMEKPSQPTQNNGDHRSDIIITGTLFRDSNVTLISPATVITAATLERANITTAQEAVRSVSADSAGSISTAFRSGFSAGGAAVSLRGLGVSSTVILIDGLRSANFPLLDDGHNAYVDLNSIPFSIVDHVEVLKDGASSTYGADAIGGVVNLISKKHFEGVEGAIQGGTTAYGDGSHYRASLTVGYGDYTAKGWNLYLNSEYTSDGYITNHARGYPFNTIDLRRSGLSDGNGNHSSLLIPNPEAVVTRVRQRDLNNPLAGYTGKQDLVHRYQLLDPASCPRGTFIVSDGPAQGTGCTHDLIDEYAILQPRQQRYSTTAHFTTRLGEHYEAFATGSYSHSEVTIPGSPSSIRQTQPFAASPSLASNNPGIVLPVYVCSAGVDCSTAADRRLNPNNPYAVPAADPHNSAARIYYLFGDIPRSSYRYVDVFRGSAGLSGQLGNGFSFRLNGVYARDDFSITQYGALHIPGLLQAINTGAYDFVHPDRNTAAVRRQISPDHTTRSNSTIATVGGSLIKVLTTLPGGDFNVGAGFQLRRETLLNRNQNAGMDYYGLNSSSASGRQTVMAGFFEVDAPFRQAIDLNISGRYDHYSQGYSHFSPKVGIKVTPKEAIAFRATYSQGFRAPTFAENNPVSNYAGFSPYTPEGSFVAAHQANPVYAYKYSIGSAARGNANLLPEVSRSITFGTILRPTPWFSLTVDYYNIKKSNLIVSGPLRADAIAAYYRQTTQAAGCAALAAVGPGYRCNIVDVPDPLAPDTLPRLLVFDVPFVNANYEVSSGLDMQGALNVPLSQDVRLISRIDVTRVLRLDLVTPAGVIEKYAGTLGPNDLSSGSGTPRVRGNWQNAVEIGAFSLAATTYYVSRIKQVAADEITPVDGVIDLSCQHTLVPLLPGADPRQHCFIRPFIYVDLNAGVKVGDQMRFFVNVQNVTNARAPLAAGAYPSAPNYLISWHYAGVVGRNFSAGASFTF